MLIGANPGYRVIYDEEDGTLYVGDDVIAWHIELPTVNPITISGRTGQNFFGILTSDGRVIAPDVGEWFDLDSAEKFVAELFGKK